MRSRMLFSGESMNLLKKLKGYFTPTEIAIWTSSVFLIILAFIVFDRENYLTLTASLLGATSLMLCAKGNPIGQIIVIIFSTLYAYISYTYSYYGEMITYMCMTAPMAVLALISWLRNPYNGNHAEVRVNRISRRELCLMLLLSLFVTVVFYFILKAFGTANLLVSTLSITTSFAAVYLTYRRSPYFAVAYALNDVVLISLWLFATLDDPSYVSVIICFVTFLANDVYSFLNWRRMEKRQSEG